MREHRNQIHKRLVASADSKTKDKLLRLVPGAKVIGLSVPKLREMVAEFRRENVNLTLDRACDLMDETLSQPLARRNPVWHFPARGLSEKSGRSAVDSNRALD